ELELDDPGVSGPVTVEVDLPQLTGLLFTRFLDPGPQCPEAALEIGIATDPRRRDPIQPRQLHRLGAVAIVANIIGNGQRSREPDRRFSALDRDGRWHPLDSDVFEDRVQA